MSPLLSSDVDPPPLCQAGQTSLVLQSGSGSPTEFLEVTSFVTMGPPVHTLHRCFCVSGYCTSYLVLVFHVCLAPRYPAPCCTVSGASLLLLGSCLVRQTPASKDILVQPCTITCTEAQQHFYTCDSCAAFSSHCYVFPMSAISSVWQWYMPCRGIVLP